MSSLKITALALAMFLFGSLESSFAQDAPAKKIDEFLHPFVQAGQFSGVVIYQTQRGTGIEKWAILDGEVTRPLSPKLHFRDFVSNCGGREDYLRKTRRVFVRNIGHLSNPMCDKFVRIKETDCGWTRIN